MKRNRVVSCDCHTHKTQFNYHLTVFLTPRFSVELSVIHRNGNHVVGFVKLFQ